MHLFKPMNNAGIPNMIALNHFAYKNQSLQNVSEDEFDLTIPRSISPRYPQIAYSDESALQRHQS